MRKALTITLLIMMLSIPATLTLAQEEASETEVTTHSADIKQEKTTEAEEGEFSPIIYFMSIAVASAFAMAIAAIGAAISQARAAVSAMEAVARQPEASGKIQIQMILALVFIETLAIYTLVVVLILLFANPFTKYVVG